VLYLSTKVSLMIKRAKTEFGRFFLGGAMFGAF
jgi:hypothetical protein